MPHSLISVIVPNYNHAHFLPERISSILNQTYDNFEIIILDDHSTDESREVIEKYRENSKVSEIVYNSENSGSPFRQWDKGLEIANGEYIWIAESDDKSDITFLDELVRPLKENLQVVLSFCQSVIISPHGNILGKTNNKNLSGIISGAEFNRRCLLGENIICNASAVIFRKDATKKMNRAYLNMSYCGDWYFFAQLSFMGDIYVSGKYLNYFVRHKNTATFKPKKESFNEQKIIYQYIRQNPRVQESDIVHALRIKAFGYLQIRRQLDSKEDRHYIYQLLLSMDRRMRFIFLRMRIKKLASSIYHLLISFRRNMVGD
ncbi:MAG: glycosyltransferase family 2 protein [Chitinophagaceae bacterium]|nr:MAG: glycosyltransferase family 2 protein [Chitinophagaceae bacterium]